MTPLEIINTLTAKDRLAVEQIIIDLWMSGERNFFTAAQLALNFDIRFKVGKVPRIAEFEDDEPPSTFTWNHFHTLAKQLTSNTLTDSESKRLMVAAAEMADPNEWNDFYSVILKREFPWVKAHTLNKMLRKLSSSDPNTLDYLVCELGRQEYHKENNTNKLKTQKGVKMVSPVIAGTHCIFVLDKTKRSAILYSYSNSVTFVDEHDLPAIFDSLPCSMVIEGVYDAWMVDDSQIHMVDCLPLEDYYRGECSMPYRDRQAILTGVLGVMLRLYSSRYQMVQKLSVDFNTDQGRTNLREFQQTLQDEGYDSILVCDPNAPWGVGKSKHKNVIIFQNHIED